MSPVRENSPNTLAAAALFVKKEPTPSPKRVTWADDSLSGYLSMDFPEHSLLTPGLLQPMAEHDPEEVNSEGVQPAHAYGRMQAAASIHAQVNVAPPQR